MGSEQIREIFANNLRKLLQLSDKKQADVLRDLGIKQTTFSSWCNGTKFPRADKLDMLAIYFGVSREALISENLGEAGADNVLDGYFPKVQYAGPIAAHFNATPTELREYWPVPPEWLGHRKPEDFFIALVDGNSMYPHYQNGDHILCLRCSDMEYSGRVGIMLLAGGEATLKKIEYKPGEDWVDLVPMNPEYMTTRIEGADLEQCRVVGRVVRLIRKTDDI